MMCMPYVVVVVVILVSLVYVIKLLLLVDVESLCDILMDTI